MKIRLAVILGLLGLVVAGCHSDPSISLLERDNNEKEMQIYHLKCRVADLEEQLNAATPSSPNPPGGAVTRPAAPGEISSEPAQSAPAFTPPSQPREEPLGPSISPLNISPGTESKPGEVPNTLKSGGEPGRIPAPGHSSQWRPSSVQLTGGALPADNRTVMQITLHPSLTGGIGGGPLGDQGMLVVVEPRDQAGNLVLAPGETSIALIDPALPGQQGRLARWDFTEAQTERMMHTGADPGIHLRLPWSAAPEHDRLMVFVRYKTQAGLTLEAKRLIEAAVAGPRMAEPPPRPAIEPSPPDDRPKRPQWSPDR